MMYVVLYVLTQWPESMDRMETIDQIFVQLDSSASLTLGR